MRKCEKGKGKRTATQRLWVFLIFRTNDFERQGLTPVTPTTTAVFSERTHHTKVGARRPAKPDPKTIAACNQNPDLQSLKV